jgi:hypothetical protein
MYEAIAPSLRLMYDQREPVGQLGRGSHYSVFRGVHSKSQPPSFGEGADFHDFAVVWDEDHDTRILTVVEEMYLTGLLSPVLVVGERKGCLHIIISDGVFQELGARGVEEFRERVAECAHVDGDIWTVQVTSFKSAATRIIDADSDSVTTYLANINLLWRLGVKPAREK